MKLSVIIPAFNEAKCLETCLAHLRAALNAVGRPGFTHELIVVDNNSTDATAELARQAGAGVIFEPLQQIARARNAGAAAATGGWLLFVDADTLVSPATLVEMLSIIEAGKSVGGGTILRYDRTPPFWRAFLLVANHLVIRLLRWTPGCFIFCSSVAFRAVSGFDERFFAGEDAEFGQALRRWGRARGLELAILRRHPPVTSIRRIDLYGTREVFLLILRWLLAPRRTTRDKRWLRVHYDGRR